MKFVEPAEQYLGRWFRYTHEKERYYFLIPPIKRTGAATPSFIYDCIYVDRYAEHTDYRHFHTRIGPEGIEEHKPTEQQLHRVIRFAWGVFYDAR